MDRQDFVFLNMPGLLERKAQTLDRATGEFRESPEWAARFQARLHALVGFLLENGLVRGDVTEDLASLVLRYSDLTERGRKFVMTGATDRWLASFDRKPDKPATDVAYLVKQLAKID